MAITLGSTESAGAGHRSTSGTLAWSFNNVAGTKLFVGIVASSVAAVTLNAPTYGGVAMTLVGSQLSFDTGKAKLAIYYKDTPLTGANNVSFTYSGGAGLNALGGAISFLGAATGVGANVTGTATGVTTVSASSSITTASGNYIFAVGAWGSGAGGAPGSGFTQTYLLNGSGGTAADDILGEYQSSSGSAITPAFSWTNNDAGAIIAVEITVAGAAGGGPLVRGGELTKGALIRGGRLAAA